MSRCGVDGRAKGVLVLARWLSGATLSVALKRTSLHMLPASAEEKV
jgi:hypothetical protein